jgi:hypothetical protein
MHEPIHGLALRHIGDGAVGVKAGIPNVLGRLLDSFRLEIDRDDRRAFPRQRDRDCFADSAGRAGHQRGLAFQLAPLGWQFNCRPNRGFTCHNVLLGYSA